MVPGAPLWVPRTFPGNLVHRCVVLWHVTSLQCPRSRRLHQTIEKKVRVLLLQTFVTVEGQPTLQAMTILCKFICKIQRNHWTREHFASDWLETYYTSIQTYCASHIIYSRWAFQLLLSYKSGSEVFGVKSNGLALTRTWCSIARAVVC